jgi:hypothetical protein
MIKPALPNSVKRQEDNMDPFEGLIVQISAKLRKLYLEAMGREPDPQALRQEVARYGADAWFKEVFGNPF